MKRTLLYSIIALFTTCAFAQDNHKNVVKLNLPGLGASVFPLQYERVLNKNMSVALGITFIPSKSLPSAISVDELSNAKFKGYAVTPEFRFYPGKKEKHQAPHGFYLAPYLRFAKYTLASPYTFESKNSAGATETSTFNFEATYKATGGGLMIGMQWLIKNRVTIDWWILGLQGGSATPSFSITGSDFASLDADQQSQLKEKLEEIGKSVPLVKSYSATVNNTGASLTVKMPYAGLRSGLCIGIAF